MTIVVFYTKTNLIFRGFIEANNTWTELFLTPVESLVKNSSQLLKVSSGLKFFSVLERILFQYPFNRVSFSFTTTLTNNNEKKEQENDYLHSLVPKYKIHQSSKSV